VTEQKTPKKTTAERIRQKCDQVADLLIDKNRSYCDSALNPGHLAGVGQAEAACRGKGNS